MYCCTLPDYGKQGEKMLILKFLAALFPIHTKLQTVSVFWNEPELPPLQGCQMNPKVSGTEVGMLLTVRPPEILAPGTPGRSHGTKIFASKFFSYHPQMMLFYAFFGFMWAKLEKNRKTGSFWLLLLIINKGFS